MFIYIYIYIYLIHIYMCIYISKLKRYSFTIRLVHLARG